MFYVLKSKSWPVAALLLLSLIQSSVNSAEKSDGTSLALDLKLSLVKSKFGLRPLDSKEFYATPKYTLGQALFFDPILSGNRDVSCATCHLIKHGTSDGLSKSIGVGGYGLGKDRTPGTSREIHPRNSLDLWNRDHNDVRSMFWDGRVEMLDPSKRIFRTPLGKDLPSGLDNAMAAQALFPLITPDEMLGYPGDKSAKSLPPKHSQQINELANAYAISGSPVQNANHIYELLMQRLLGGNESELTGYQTAYQELFQNAFPNGRIWDFSIVHVANALAHFEEIAFSTRESRWDQYLAGDTSSISNEAKKGAILFYGKGRCAACHSGEIQSDFDYHSIGVVDDDSRIANDQRDLGRYVATGNDKDRYKFRTPPLRNVLFTAPYFHNGSAPDLESVIEQHLNPMKNANRYHESGKYLMIAKQIRAISPILANGLQLNEQEITFIINFLETLSYEISPEDFSKIVPESVPSQIAFEYY